MKAFKWIFFQAVCLGVGLSLCLPAMAAEDCGGFAAINPYPFGRAFAWGGPNTGNNASTLDFVSTWVGYEINGGLNGACDGCREASRLNITAGVTQTLMHGNLVNGKVAWDPAIENKRIPVSYFLTEKPSFLANSPWPLFGPDATGDHKLPAQLRYESGNPILGK